MIKIINNILLSNGYMRVDLDLRQGDDEIYLFQPLGDNVREEYFVSVKLDIQSDESAQYFLEEKTEVLFERISNSGKVNGAFEKNCTMLFCHEEDKISRQTILIFEEDQYNFKKNVVSYFQQELTSIKAYLNKIQIEKLTNSVINDIINANNGNSFLDFKKNHKQQKDYFSIILKTSLKLPFITYSPQEKQLINLDHDIENSLDQDQFSIYRQLENSDMEWTDENVLQQVERMWGGLV